MSIRDFVKRVLNGHASAYMNGASGHAALPDLEPEPEPIVSLRFKVTVPKAPTEAAGRVLFVYGCDQKEALGRLPGALLVDATVEPAGDATGGVVRVPEGELRETMKSMVEDRKAPGA